MFAWWTVRGSHPGLACIRRTRPSTGSLSDQPGKRLAPGQQRVTAQVCCKRARLQHPSTSHGDSFLLSHADGLLCCGIARLQELGLRGLVPLDDSCHQDHVMAHSFRAAAMQSCRGWGCQG